MILRSQVEGLLSLSFLYSPFKCRFVRGYVLAVEHLILLSMHIWTALWSALALSTSYWHLANAQISDTFTGPVSSNPCGQCTYPQRYYEGGWWTTGVSITQKSVEAVTVLVLTNNGTNTTRTTTIFNFPSGVASATNSDGYALHTQTVTVGTTLSTTVLTFPTGYAAYQQSQSWEGTIPATVGQGLNATRTCSTAPESGTASLFPTPELPAFPTPTPGAIGNNGTYDRNGFYSWIFVEGGNKFADCDWPFARSYRLSYQSLYPDFPIYDICTPAATLVCPAATLGTAQYLTVTSTAADTHTSSTKGATSTPHVESAVASPSPTPSTGPSQTTLRTTPTVESTPKSTATPSKSPASPEGSTPSVDVSPSSPVSAADASPSRSVTPTEPNSPAAQSTTVTSFQVTTNGAGNTVAVVSTRSEQITTFSSFRTTTDQSGSPVAVVAPTDSDQPSSTITSFQITTDQGGQSVAVVSSESEQQNTFSSFHTTTNGAGQTIAVIAPASSPNTPAISAETITTDSRGQTAAVISTNEIIPVALFTLLQSEGGSVETLTGTAAVPNSGGKPFLYTSDGVVIAATPTTNTNGQSVIEIATQSLLPVITNSAGSTLLESIGQETTTVSTPFTYVSGGRTTTFTPSSGHSVVTFETTKTAPLTTGSSTTDTTDIGGYVNSGIGGSGGGGQSSASATSTGTGQPNAATKPGHSLIRGGAVIILALTIALVRL